MLAATSDQIFALEETDSTALHFAQEGILRLEQTSSHTAVALEDGRVLLLTAEGTTQLSNALPEPIESLLFFAADPAHLLVGTEGPHIYRLVEGSPPQRLDNFEILPCREQWYTPWGGPPAVRSLARSGDWIYADIHVGSIMRSPDQGVCWEPVTPELHEDVHQVATAPLAPERVYANTAAAVYLSEDRGSSWHHRSNGLPQHYGRAIAVHPHDPDCLLATVSGGPGNNVDAKLFRSADAGLTWTHATAGFPATTRHNIDTFQLTFSADGSAWAAVEETLYKSTDRGHSWTATFCAPKPIIALT